METWVNVGNTTHWTPKTQAEADLDGFGLAGLPLTFQAVNKLGTSLTFPNGFDGTIDDNFFTGFGFVSEKTAAMISWNQGTFTNQSAAPGWGANISNGGSYQVNSSETQFIVPNSSTAQTVASGSVSIVPEPSAALAVATLFLVAAGTKLLAGSLQVKEKNALW